jgi:hypothetical protein
MKAIDDATLKAVFLRMFNKLYESKEDFFKTFTDNIDKVLKQSAKCEDIFKIDREIENINEDIKSLVRQQIKGELKEKVFDLKYKILNERLQELKNSKDTVAFDNEKYAETLKRSKEIRRVIEMRENTLTEFDDYIFENLIEKVVVITTTHLEFHLKNGMKVEENLLKREESTDFNKEENFYAKGFSNTSKASGCYKWSSRETKKRFVLTVE